MDVCSEFVRLQYFVPCECGSQKRHFCTRKKKAYCHECFPEKVSHSIKVYRNMHQDVIRVPTENYGDVRTFRCNGKYVINLRPSPTMTTSSLYTTFCLCGRGISWKSKYCSIQCLTRAAVNSPPRPPPPPPPPKKMKTSCRRVKFLIPRRRKSVPQQSYVL